MQGENIYALNEYEITESSTWRFPIQFALQSFAQKLSNKTVRWEIENYAGPLIVASGCNKAQLQTLTENTYEPKIKHSIVLQVKWTPLHKSQIAGALSKTYEIDVWEITDTLFYYLNRLWDPFTVDRIVGNKNKKFIKFDSIFWCCDTSQVDAFAIGWGNNNNCMVPMIYLVLKVIKHLQSPNGQGILVVPFWPLASFRPFLQSYTSKEFNTYVVDFKVFTQPHQCFWLENNKSSLIGSSKFKS